MYNIFKLIIFAFIILWLPACKKALQQVEGNVVTQAIVTGRWKISNYIKKDTNLTSEFTAYELQFKDNNTVDVYKNGTIDKTGAWEPNVTTMTINSNFTNAVYPYTLLNGLWHITKNSWTYVEATQTVNGEVLILRIDKI
jgi:hypothetical protein